MNRFVDYLSTLTYDAEKFTYVRVIDKDRSMLSFTLNDFFLSMNRKWILDTLYKVVSDKYTCDGVEYVVVGGTK